MYNVQCTPTVIVSDPEGNSCALQSSTQNQT